jgi:hypothetical protein
MAGDGLNTPALGVVLRTARRTHHLRKSPLTDLRNDLFGLPLLAETCYKQEYSGQALFAGVEKLVNQILFVSNVAAQQISDK